MKQLEFEFPDDKENYQKELISKLIESSTFIRETSMANYIQFTEKFIQEQAEESNVSFDDMVKIIKKELSQMGSSNYDDIYYSPKTTEE